ncbi:DUF4199 domain-containing protein [Allomuricauda sp. M10]|uniref:DUF4199 domain-containing protein n=1 Tax=Allomuricauda sp. M10 TaxID=2683292 RepID=UPI001D18CA79|nr:DUF4199 domain-containing protein [Muricauda sp. M10]
MKKTILKYGAFGAITICVLFIFSWYGLSTLSLPVQEVLGYVSIFLSLCFVYLGIRHYRDKENGGAVSFKQALTMGLLISLITAIIFGLLDVFYTEVLNPGFMDYYYAEIAENMKGTLPPDELRIRLAELEEQKAQFSNPILSFTFMATTVFAIGLIITLLSALILQRKAES